MIKKVLNADLDSMEFIFYTDNKLHKFNFTDRGFSHHQVVSDYDSVLQNKDFWKKLILDFRDTYRDGGAFICYFVEEFKNEIYLSDGVNNEIIDFKNTDIISVIEKYPMERKVEIFNAYNIGFEYLTRNL